MAQPSRPLPPPLIAAASWVLPGLGYLLLGQRARGITVGVTVVVLFLMGLLIGGVRVLEVPGYDDKGNAMTVGGSWVMVAAPFSELREKPWSIAQILAGPVAIAGMKWSIWAAPRVDVSHVRVNEIGVLYTAVAGMLNLLAILDAAGRASAAQDASKGNQ